MNFWWNKPKKNEPPPRTTIKYENDKIIIQTYLTKDEAVATREEIRENFRKIPKLSKSTFEQFWEDIVDQSIDEYLETCVQQLADESEKPSKFESW